MSVKRHLLILLTLTVLIRGVMFISYPLGGQDESQGFYRYNVEQILAGDWQIGNVRYAPGFPLFMAPVSALGDLFGRFDDRIELLFQLTLASLIPFLLYDILRTRHSTRAAFVVAILSLIDPFGLQWAHFFMPVWWVALNLVLALWLLHHAERQRSWRLVVLAGLVTALGILGRWNYAPVAISLGSLIIFAEQEPIRRRLASFTLFGGSVVGVILLILLTVQVPATGGWYLSCISALNLVEALRYSNMTLHEDHGSHSKRLLHLSQLPPLTQHKTANDKFQVWTTEVFPLWQTPGTWVTEADRLDFISQTAVAPASYIQQPNIYQLTNWLFYYLGPCETDQLLRQVFFENITTVPTPWLLKSLTNIWQMLQPPLSTDDFINYSLPTEASLKYESGSDLLGFQLAYGHWNHYTGQWVWRPGIEIYSRLLAPLNALRYLLFPALIWALFSRQHIYKITTAILLLYLVVIGVVDYPPEHRIYAIVYPLGPALVGGFLMALWDQSRNWIASR